MYSKLMLNLNIDHYCTCQRRFQVSYNSVFLFKCSLQLKWEKKNFQQISIVTLAMSVGVPITLITTRDIFGTLGPLV